MKKRAKVKFYIEKWILFEDDDDLKVKIGQECSRIRMVDKKTDGWEIVDQELHFGK